MLNGFAGHRLSSSSGMRLHMLAIFLFTLSACLDEGSSPVEAEYDCSKNCVTFQRILEARNGGFSSLRGEKEIEESGQLRWQGKVQITGATGCFVFEDPAEYVCTFGWLEPAVADERMRLLEVDLLEFITQEFERKREWHGPERYDLGRALKVRWSNHEDHLQSRDTLLIDLIHASADKDVLSIYFYAHD